MSEIFERLSAVKIFFNKKPFEYDVKFYSVEEEGNFKFFFQKGKAVNYCIKKGIPLSKLDESKATLVWK